MRVRGSGAFMVALTCAALACGQTESDDFASGASGGPGSEVTGGAAGNGVPSDAVGSFAGRASTGSGGITNGGAASGGTTNAGAAGSSGAAFAGAGGDPDLLSDLYVDPVRGSDAASGTKRDPLRSLSHAVTRAAEDVTIWLEDGTYSAATEPGFAAIDSPCGAGAGIRVPDGVTVRASNPGRAILLAEGSYALCFDSGRVDGVHFESGALRGTAIESTSGELLIANTTFAMNGGHGGALHLLNTARVLLSAGDLTGYGTVTKLAQLEGSAQLRIEGGSIEVIDEHVAFVVDDRARLEAVDLSVRGVGSARGTGASVFTDGTAVFERVRFEDLSYATKIAHADAHVVWNDVTVSECSVGIHGTAGTIDVRASTIADVNVALRLVGNAIDVHVSGTDITNSTFGIFAQSGSGLMTLESTHIRNGVYGLLLFTNQPARLRHVHVAGQQELGVMISASAAHDLGTATDPGNNDFSGNALSATGESNMVLTGGSELIHAVGNLWDANVQGADGDGRYHAPAGTPLDVTEGTGRNFVFRAPGPALRLAE